MQQKEFYTAGELAEKLSVNIMTIYRYIKSGKLEAHRIGKEFRIKVRVFENFINRSKTNK